MRGDTSMRAASAKKGLAVLLVLFIASALVFTGCAGHIEDSNGEDTALVTITYEELAGNSISNISSGVSTTRERYNYTILTQHEDIDLDYLEMAGGKTSGVVNLMATALEAGAELTIACESSVEEGNIAIVLLSPDNEILHEFAIGEYEEVTITAQTDGEYLVRMGCESFSGTIILAREF